MNLKPKTYNLKPKENGQTLIELVVAIGVFLVILSIFAFLLFQSYEAGRLASEITQANFLAEEGLEAARSIRDNSWAELNPGTYYIDNSTGNWRFLPGSETIDEKFVRSIIIEELDPNRKKIISQVNWQFTQARPQEVKLVTYLTNWQKIIVPYCSGTCTPCSEILDRATCEAQDGCSWSVRRRICFDDPGCTPCDSYTTEPECIAQIGCQWIIP